MSISYFKVRVTQIAYSKTDCNNLNLLSRLYLMEIKQIFQIMSAPFHRSSKRWNLLFEQWDRWAPLLFFNREPDLVSKKDLEAINEIRRKFFRSDHETSIPTFNKQNLKLLEQIFSVAVFQAPLCRDIQLMVIATKIFFEKVILNILCTLVKRK